MSTAPSLAATRHRPLHGATWPAADSGPSQAQRALHALCWPMGRDQVDDTTRSQAARGAIAVAVEGHDRFPGIPEGEEAQSFMRQALGSREVVSNAVRLLGPLPPAHDERFGVLLLGVVYDYYLLVCERRAALTALAAWSSLPPARRDAWIPSPSHRAAYEADRQAWLTALHRGAEPEFR
ncbi:hypothetical protein [Nocardioides sp. Leaf285]|uniref:hypothetical protein n=1 Tax=Nocardioides sp. Leaf285 TaxID=1736322 RepID=UPI000702A59B|nr:hypothetical protein [Nocardioides sp. Leaf285]KQP62825.1 hypothetical protein ASF47_17590 [Nocardioides sp. Leaf285]